MQVQARLIGIHPQTRKSDGSTFLSYSFCTLKPVGLALQSLVDEGLMDETAVAEMAASGTPMDETAVISITENDALLPEYVLSHVFDIDGITNIVMSVDPDTKSVQYHKKNPTEPCLKAVSRGETYRTYTYVGRMGSTVTSLPSPPTGSAVAASEETLPEEVL